MRMSGAGRNRSNRHVMGLQDKIICRVSSVERGENLLRRKGSLDILCRNKGRRKGFVDTFFQSG